ncbi:MAG: hypothetical protein K2X47_05055 [Bdellovibrionales bacterium]|nr:hypothetical protein [Bdellovibrionales bacterium]
MKISTRMAWVFWVFSAQAQAVEPQFLPYPARSSAASEKRASERLTESLKQEPLGKKTVRVKGGPDHVQILQQQWIREMDQRQNEQLRLHNGIPTH